MKTIRNIFYKSIITALAFLCFSCSNSLTKDNDITTPADGKTYITVSAIVNNASRQGTLVPAPQISDLTNFVLKGNLVGQAQQQLNQSAINSYASLESQQFALEPGDWIFTLSAELNGVTFSGTCGTSSVPVEVSASTVNPVMFTLVSSQTTGGLDITIPFEGDADKVRVQLRSTTMGVSYFDQLYTESGATYKILTNGGQKYVEFIWDISNTETLEAGTYLLTCDFSAGDSSPLATMNSYVRVAGGITTTVQVNTVYLDSLYTINYHYMLNGTEVTGDAAAGISLANNTDLLMDKYSRRSQNYTLPAMVATGYVFEGWYSDSALALADKIETIPSGSTQNKDVYARFIDTLYVARGGTSNADGTRSTAAFASLGNAMQKIYGYRNAGIDTSSVDWKINVSGKIEAPQEILNSKINSSNAHSLTIQGSDNSTDIIDGCEEGPAIKLQTYIPVTIKKLTFTNGSDTYGGGVYIDAGQSNNKTVYLEECKILTNEAQAGGGLYIGEKVNATITDTVIQQNTVSGSNSPGTGIGGGVFVSKNSYLTITGNTLIQQNSATTENRLNTNGCGYGGGIYNLGLVNMEGGIIAGNMATLNGGGVYCGGDSDNISIFCMKGDAVIGDTETHGTYYAQSGSRSNYSEYGSGGGICIENGRLYFGRSFNIATQQYVMENLTGGIYYNYAPTGGGIAVAASQNEGLVSIDSGYVSCNGAQDGGGIYVSPNATLQNNGGKFTKNYAVNGGAIYTEAVISLHRNIDIPAYNDNNYIFLRGEVYIELMAKLESTTDVIKITAFNDGNLDTKKILRRDDNMDPADFATALTDIFRTGYDDMNIENLDNRWGAFDAIEMGP